jgi:hypothetical protein
MANWLQTVNRNLGGQRGANFAKAGVSLATGNPLGAVYYGIKGFNTPTQTGWGSAISKTPYNQPIGGSQQPGVQDFYNQIPTLASGLFSPSIPKADYGTTAQDVSNTFSAPTGSGLQMPQEQQAPQAQAPQAPQQEAPKPIAPRITPQKMPMPSDLDAIMAQLNPQGMGGYQSRAMPSPINPMTSNKGYFDMNKAGTVGGNYIEGAGWMTDAARAFGLKPEDLEFQAMMNQRIAGMYA